MKRLSTILTYQNPRVINKLRENTGLSENESMDVFAETLKWLWLNGYSIKNGYNRLVMPDSMEIIDQAWHTFILFTREYEAFCKKFLGLLIHHTPGPTVYDVGVGFKTSSNDLFSLVYLVHKELGRQTVMKWFYEYPDRYKHIVNNIINQKMEP
jgi:hypothetical protein